MIWAKSDPEETLFVHTEKLVERLEVLKKSYGHYIAHNRVWELLLIAAWYHDAGKAYTPFQNRITKALKKKGIAKTSLPDIPHNILSPFFLPLSKLGLSKDEKRVLIQAIAYHHEREYQVDNNLLSRVYEEDLVKKLDLIKAELNRDVGHGESTLKTIKHLQSNDRIRSSDRLDLYQLYIYVKGLLHRLDHAASAGVPIELDVDFDLAQMTENYIRQITNKEKDYLRPLQCFALEHQNQNLIVIGQTGSGKTEAALLWAGKMKTFFTLPLRVSLNALHDRIFKDMGFKGAGLLHSSSASYLQEKGLEDWEVIRDQSKQLANKILFTTIDQVLKFPSKYLGYEKFYATMAYSAVIIDEIQAYDPKIVAYLIKALEMIDAIGGKFMIMTATMPKIFLEEMTRRGKINFDSVSYKVCTDDRIVRHRIQLHDQTIEDAIEQIVENGAKKKVLVIVNTVKQARSLFNKLKEFDANVRLLHSAFIQKHRAMLEDDLKQFNKDRNLPGIWITTQLVEASMDIDFDELYTEVATLDSLFQRFGRCYRNRPLDLENANIHIYTSQPSDNGHIYKDYLVKRGIEMLSNLNMSIILESVKVELVDQLYSRKNLVGTGFLEEFEQAFKEIDAWQDYELTQEDAQKQLRSIQNELVIPQELYNSGVSNLVIQLSFEEDKKKREELRREVEKYTLSISSYIARDCTFPILETRRGKDGRDYKVLPYIKTTDLKYDFDEENRTGLGIRPDERCSNIL